MDRYHSAISTVPPVVRARTAGGLAYLLAWVHTSGGLRARITWVAQWRDSPETWRWEVAEIPAGEVSEVDGQIYSGVPRGPRSAEA